MLQADDLRPEYVYSVRLLYLEPSDDMPGSGVAAPVESQRIVGTTHADSTGTVWLSEELSGVYPEQISPMHLVLVELHTADRSPAMAASLHHRVDRVPDDEHAEPVASVTVQVQ